MHYSYSLEFKEAAEKIGNLLAWCHWPMAVERFKQFTEEHTLSKLEREQFASECVKVMCIPCCRLAEKKEMIKYVENELLGNNQAR